MPYRVIAKVMNITGVNYNSWEEFKPVYHEYLSEEARVNFITNKGAEIGLDSESIQSLENFLTNPIMTVEWDNLTNTATITADWPSKEVYDMFDLCKSYMTSINASVDIISKEII